MQILNYVTTPDFGVSFLLAVMKHRIGKHVFPGAPKNVQHRRDTEVNQIYAFSFSVGKLCVQQPQVEHATLAFKCIKCECSTAVIDSNTVEAKHLSPWRVQRFCKSVTFQKGISLGKSFNVCNRFSTYAEFAKSSTFTCVDVASHNFNLANLVLGLSFIVCFWSRNARVQ